MGQVGAVGLPREIADGITWFGECLHAPLGDEIVHGYNSVYLVSGTECSLLVEAGAPRDLPMIEAQLGALLDDAPPLRYVFTTHTEAPHAAGVGRLLQRFPDVMVCGDVEDLHLIFPEYTDRMRQLAPGDELALGGTTFRVVEGVMRDMPRTRWGYDTARRSLFPGDGFAYAHYHRAGQCGKLAEEVPTLDLPSMTALFSIAAFYWTRFVDIELYIERLAELVFSELVVDLVAPTHGLPISDVRARFPDIGAGLRLGTTSTLNDYTRPPTSA